MGIVTNFFWKNLTRISSELSAKVLYYSAYHKRLDLKNPYTFHEKLQWLKIYKYNRSPLVRQCADKYAVRQYIEDKGLADILIPLYAVYDQTNEIKWNDLPDSFVMKWNFGSGMNVVIPDKREIDSSNVIAQMRKWQNNNNYLVHGELQYRCRKKILVEQYLKPLHGGLPADYKVYCFNGIPRAILFIDGRATSQKTAAFYDTAWNFISEPNNGVYSEFTESPNAPIFLNKMLEISSKLSQPFEFVRIDFYEENSHLFFSEMTFTPAGGFFTSQCEVNGKTMGEILKIDTDKPKEER